MIKDIYLVISLSDQFFQLVHFSVVSQIAAVKDAIHCRGPTNKLKKLKYIISLTNINPTKNYIKHAKLFLRLSLADFLPRFFYRLYDWPFSSYLMPLFPNESRCKTFHMKISLTCMKMNIFSYEYFPTKTHFKTEAMPLNAISEVPFGKRHLRNGL